MTAYRSGDRVRVTLEGEVIHKFKYDRGISLGLDGGARVDVVASRGGSLTIERVESPVKTFGPGSFVRDRDTKQVFYLGIDGYVQVAPNPGRTWSYEVPGEDDEKFTSERYEKVSYAEVPF